MSTQEVDFSSYHVGVFDSGRGGQHFALKLKSELPRIRVTSLDDIENIPYGLKTPDQLLQLIKPFIARFEALAVDAIVIACNTCFMNLAPQLRQMTQIPILGFMPPLAEAAAQSLNKSIVVCATRGTLRSKRWRDMKQAQSASLKIIDIDCTDWVPLIEKQLIKPAHIQPVIETIVDNAADSLILGCTHYHWIKNDILNLIPAGYVLHLYEPTQKIMAQLLKLLSESVAKDLKQ